MFEASNAITSVAFQTKNWARLPRSQPNVSQAASALVSQITIPHLVTINHLTTWCTDMWHIVFLRILVTMVPNSCGWTGFIFTTSKHEVSQQFPAIWVRSQVFLRHLLQSPYNVWFFRARTAHLRHDGYLTWETPVKQRKSDDSKLLSSGCLIFPLLWLFTAFIFVGDGEGLLPGVSAVDDGALYDLEDFG